jgi:ATP-dependent Clp protease, protease subunit
MTLGVLRRLVSVTSAQAVQPWHQPFLPLLGTRSYFVPMVVEAVPGGERAMDIWSLLLKKRIVFVQGEINDANANMTVAQLLYLESVHPHEPVHMYINSPGGSVTAGLAVLDTMAHISPPVETCVTGLAGSMGSLLLAAGSRGKRRALPHARVMLHQPLGGTSGQASDIEIQAQQMQKTKETIVGIYAEHTGQPVELLYSKLDRDFWLTASEAQEFGIIDSVIKPRPRPDPDSTAGAQQ